MKTNDFIEVIRKIMGCCNPMDAKFDQIRTICTTILCQSRDNANDEKYEKFMVLYNKPGNPPNAIPWTGIGPTMEFIKEKLEEGCIVQVKPFTVNE